MSVEDAIAAIREGKPVVLPTDTVYGLCTSPYSDRYARPLYRLKGRDETKPTALMAADLDWLLECVPELRGRAAVIARTLLPGSYTLIFSNPARRFRWLTGTRPDTIGVRIPELNGPGGEVLARVGALMATSANVAGGRDPRTMDEVPAQIREGAAAVVDGGELPGTPSTVLDFTGPEPVVVREGAAAATEALERVAAALDSPS
jgi:L-threonylcarbamoyladenylate synthase